MMTFIKWLSSFIRHLPDRYSDKCWNNFVWNLSKINTESKPLKSLFRLWGSEFKHQCEVCRQENIRKNKNTGDRFTSLYHPRFKPHLQRHIPTSCGLERGIPIEYLLKLAKQLTSTQNRDESPSSLKLYQMQGFFLDFPNLWMFVWKVCEEQG